MPQLRLLNPPTQLQLEELKSGNFGPEQASRGGAFSAADLLRWSKLHTIHIQKRITKAHLDDLTNSLWNADTFRQGLTPDQFGSYLDGIQQQAKGLMDWWSFVTSWLYKEFTLIGSICSIIVVIA